MVPKTLAATGISPCGAIDVNLSRERVRDAVQGLQNPGEEEGQILRIESG